MQGCLEVWLRKTASSLIIKLIHPKLLTLFAKIFPNDFSMIPTSKIEDLKMIECINEWFAWSDLGFFLRLLRIFHGATTGIAGKQMTIHKPTHVPVIKIILHKTTFSTIYICLA